MPKQENEPVFPDRSEEIEKQIAELKNKMLEMEEIFRKTNSKESVDALMQVCRRVDGLETKLKKEEEPKDERLAQSGGNEISTLGF